MIDEALRALVARHRSAEVDASYAAYDEHPLDEPDEWGDLASFREAAGRS
jgi:antitoxin MazE5